MSYSEIAACLAYAVSVWLAARNNVHTWWIGIIGSILYGWVFLVRATLCRRYAPVILHRDQHHWLDPLAERSGWRHLAGAPNASQSLFSFCCSVLSSWQAVTAFLLHTFTNAWAPWLDSLILTFSVLAQFMLMGRRIEKLVRLVSGEYPGGATVYARGLNLTAGLYFLFWITPGMVCINGAKSCKHHEAFCNGSGGW